MTFFINLIIYLNYIFTVNLANFILLYPIILLFIAFKDYLKDNYLNKNQSINSASEIENSKKIK